MLLPLLYYIVPHISIVNLNKYRKKRSSQQEKASMMTHLIFGEQNKAPDEREPFVCTFIIC